MSFQSLDSDEFGLLSSRSCSPSGVDTISQQYNSLEYAGKDETQSPRNTTPLVVNDRSLYQTMFMSDLASKEETTKNESSGDVNSIDRQDWGFTDFIKQPNSSCQSDLLSYDAVSPPGSTHSVTVSWDTSETKSVPVTVCLNTSETSTVPVSVSWNTLRTSTLPVTVTYSTLGTISAEHLRDENSILPHPDEEQFADAYDRVSFDGPTQHQSTLGIW
ncbi:uncharacterized protein LOC132744077, partial [Ruditapes philippinarum]|uniref:uncharacterized protein LOC132744077 n=1 Tax=Ruditapes philippinarum TaxID=129788 RepID=UPI00295C04E5